MRFRWDSNKSEDNYRRHAFDFDFDFEFAVVIFTGSTEEWPDERRDYGESRIVSVGVAHGTILTVVYTDRVASDGEIERRIISARPSNRKERQRYAKAIDEETDSRSR